MAISIETELVEEGDADATVTASSVVANIVAAIADISVLIDNGQFDLVADNTDSIGTVGLNITDVTSIADKIHKVSVLADSIDSIEAVSADLGSINNLSSNLLTILEVYNNLVALTGMAESLDNIDTLAANMGSVLVAESNIPNITTVLSHITTIQYVGDNLDNLTLAASSMDDIKSVAASITNVNTIADNIDIIDDASSYVAEIQSNLDAIEVMDANVTTLEASTQAASTLVESNKDTVISTAATIAADKAIVATNTAAMELLFDQFDDRYLGSKSADPTVDNDGNDLVAGTVYFNSTSNTVRFYTGAIWEDPDTASTNAASAALASQLASAVSEANSKISENASSSSATLASIAQGLAETAATSVASSKESVTTLAAETVTNAAKAVTAQTSAELAQTETEALFAEASNYDLYRIARSLNVLDSEVIYSTDTTTVLDDVLYIYNASTQVTYGVPTLTTTGETISIVSGSELTTSTAEVYTLLNLSMEDDFKSVEGGVINATTVFDTYISEATSELIVPFGTYLVDEISLPVNISINLNRSTLLKNTSASHLMSSETSTEGYIIIKNSILDGQNNTATFKHLLNVNNVLADVVLRNVEFKNNLAGGEESPTSEIDSDAVYIRTAASLTVDTCSFSTVSRNGVSIVGACADTLITNNTFNGCHLTGVDFEPNIYSELMFEKVTITDNIFTECGNNDVWDGAGAYTFLNSSTYLLSNKHTFENNIVDCSHSTYSSGSKLVGYRCDGANNSSVLNNTFNSCTVLNNVGANVNVDGVFITNNVFNDTEVAAFAMRKIIADNNEFEGEGCRLQLSTNLAGDNQSIIVSNSTFVNIGYYTGLVDYIMHFRSSGNILVTDVDITDDRDNEYLPTSIFTAYQGNFKFKNIHINSHADRVFDDSYFPDSISWVGGSVKNVANFISDSTHQLSNISVLDSEIDVTSTFLDTYYTSYIENLRLINTKITAAKGIFAENLLDSEIVGCTIDSETGINVSHAGTLSTNCVIRANTIRNASYSLRITGDSSTFVGDNWLYNCAASDISSASDTGTNVERDTTA